MYEVVIRNDVVKYETRIEAVKAAKDATLSSDGRITVTVTDGTETLSFRDGKLVAYTYETRRGDGSGRDQGLDLDDKDGLDDD